MIRRVSGRNNINIIEVKCDKCQSLEYYRFLKGWKFEKVEIANANNIEFLQDIPRNNEKNEKLEKKWFII